PLSYTTLFRSQTTRSTKLSYTPQFSEDDLARDDKSRTLKVSPSQSLVISLARSQDLARVASLQAQPAHRAARRNPKFGRGQSGLPRNISLPDARNKTRSRSPPDASRP